MIGLNPEHLQLQPYFAQICCEPGWKWTRHSKPLGNYDLFYVWSGRGTVEEGGTSYEVGAGSCFLFRPDDHPTATHDPQNPLNLTYIHFSLDPSCRSEGLPKRYRVLEDRVFFETLLTQYVRVRLEGGLGAEEEAKLILGQLLIRLLREDQEGQKVVTPGSCKQTEAIREVANYIRQHAAVPHKIEDLAKRANLSPRYFSHKFKEIMGISVQSYMIRMRIERAEHLLQYAGMSVSEVADALGYRDVFFFSRQFKQYTGRAPSTLR
ncbi:AraC family transcriptional regulator [Paenibacillus larvae]|uniref:MSM operon regulatory protein-like protein n=2 Tax=Paenibacillus larvae TaxID=1464 RepID=A0A6C0QWX3_9BACL|nr:AraC family transcriptional regulator [Paenibacillus larvae]AQR77762.1 hypothetical protein BXP28_10840 [Paenibacillus larvae subsp. larvae]AVF21141.1 MSM operon regulatory protein-like protein [Paenibacillus larvae subsp. larvae]ETK27797.1 MSM operon regulatory protein-like protein [Paenibacillus larvae subsp. larvae DSM 25719]MCY7492024.1 AraC family transcriptional regulator [Paenibacillus larvae]MCY9561749.1 AraC family transcriptional regulator [Paenibacillus larvae]